MLPLILSSACSPTPLLKSADFLALHGKASLTAAWGMERGAPRLGYAANCA